MKTHQIRPLKVFQMNCLDSQFRNSSWPNIGTLNPLSSFNACINRKKKYKCLLNIYELKRNTIVEIMKYFTFYVLVSNLDAQ